MKFGISFFLTSIGLGVGLAMDAFSVSLANGLHEPCMKKRRMCGIAAVFAIFQALMPLIGWICVRTIAETFTAFSAAIPWIALILLAYIGGKMIYDGIKCEQPECGCTTVSFGALLMQGVATSIDALSVGFTIADYDLTAALLAVVIIALVTFIICMMGLFIGKKAGTKLAGKATIFGGVILVLIGIEIFVSHLF